MKTWTAQQVLQAAADWTWVPDDAEHVETDFRITRYPQWSGLGVVASRANSTRAAGELVDSSLDQARNWGRPSVGWWVTDGDHPTDLEQTLIRRGADREDTVDVLALFLDAGADLAVPPSVTAEIVTTREQRLSVDAVDVAVWQHHPLTDERLEADLKEIEHDLAARTGFRVLGRLDDGTAVATGGCTLAAGPEGTTGKVARLWGAGTMPDQRGKGAYRAVLAERLRIAREWGATLALVKGRIETSGPILTRCGFTRYGSERLYRLSV
jgi:GNAT superfamily N-acetyltransferase